ncbi:hypothetical protein HBI56_044030 [Parastagonospora nodorum]|nr:hypothetical protein HBH56_057160 [Parastagonospora nodorum]KAH3931068.1 hypothetical protein HBH54_101090 [Parastagonospora nodorum]KAH3943924.1 hypothetical protein HBH53_168760 [Parastagonospora nodorum]KAH3965381.1 hypothetical protein HBH51_149650 [Parastagonospora nodorum]KAH3977346.1 hypothetical protein HBH52_110160 [Parastagonospora nodorum]
MDTYGITPKPKGNYPEVTPIKSTGFSQQPRICATPTLLNDVQWLIFMSRIGSTNAAGIHDHEEAWALGQTAQPMRFGTLGNQDMTMSRSLEITL